MNLAGKTAIVTGGGSDIGRACVMRLAEEGAKVAINYFESRDGATSAVEEIKVSDQSAFMTGSCVDINGGMLFS